MISLKDINKAIINQVTNYLINDIKYKNIDFASTDIIENIKRPSFYINFNDNKTNLLLASSKERTVQVQLFYFVKDIIKSKIELLEMQEILENIFFKHIKVNDSFYIPITECIFDINKKDGYLILNLELYTLEEIPEANGEMMEELNTRL